MADQFPRGKLNADDEGALDVRIGVRDKTVIIDFGKPHALAGIGTWSPGLEPIFSPNGLIGRAEFAYQQADAMLKARSKVKP